MQSTGPAVSLLGSTLDVGGGSVLAEERGCNFSSGVPMSERVVYLVDRLRRSHVEGVIVVICLVICDEGCIL